MRSLLRVILLILPAPYVLASMGATANVQKLDVTTNTAVIEVLNTSDKDITAFSMSVDAVYTNGKTDHSERMVDFGVFLAERQETLHPNKTNEQFDAWKMIPGNPLRQVEAKVIAVVYIDQTADVTDEGAFQRIAEYRRGIAVALQKSADILRSYLADSTNEHPSAKAATDLEQLLDQAKASKSLDIDRVHLKKVHDELQSAPQKSAELGISERDYLKRRLAEIVP